MHAAADCMAFYIMYLAVMHAYIGEIPSGKSSYYDVISCFKVNMSV